MSDEFGPLADLPADTPEDNAREYGAALARNGGDLNAINSALTKRNAAPLNANSAELAELARDRLLRDEAFVKRYHDGDPAAIDQLDAADMKVARANGKLTDRPLRADEYRLHIGPQLETYDEEGALEYESELAKFCADLNLDQVSAKALAQDHVAVVDKLERLGDDETAIEDWSRQQDADFRAVLGADADAKMKEASAILSRVSGRSLNLADIVRSNGAEIALTLYQKAEALQLRKR